MSSGCSLSVQLGGTFTHRCYISLRDREIQEYFVLRIHQISQGHGVLTPDLNFCVAHKQREPIFYLHTFSLCLHLTNDYQNGTHPIHQETVQQGDMICCSLVKQLWRQILPSDRSSQNSCLMLMLRSPPCFCSLSGYLALMMPSAAANTMAVFTTPPADLNAFR